MNGQLCIRISHRLFSQICLKTVLILHTDRVINIRCNIRYLVNDFTTVIKIQIVTIAFLLEPGVILYSLFVSICDYNNCIIKLEISLT